MRPGWMGGRPKRRACSCASPSCTEATPALGTEVPPPPPPLSSAPPPRSSACRSCAARLGSQTGFGRDAAERTRRGLDPTPSPRLPPSQPRPSRARAPGAMRPREARCIQRAPLPSAASWRQARLARPYAQPGLSTGREACQGEGARGVVRHGGTQRTRAAWRRAGRRAPLPARTLTPGAAKGQGGTKEPAVEPRPLYSRPILTSTRWPWP